MTTKELIHTEIDRVREEHLDELYDLIRAFARSKQTREPGLMSRLKRIEIDAPEDFSTNLDLYASGDRRAGPDLR